MKVSPLASNLFSVGDNVCEDKLITLSPWGGMPAVQYNGSVFLMCECVRVFLRVCGCK